MYRIGEEEARRVEKLLKSGQMFRYGMAGECDQFEAGWARHLGVQHVRMTTSGTASLYAALIGLKIGPGDSVIVPSCTYMATALAVLGTGALPIVADVDDSITLSPEDVARRIQPHTKAVIPVHMWGLCCDMDPLMSLAREKNILVVEDACQAVGGGYKGRKLGSIGSAGAFSFNYFKNMTCGEGGAFVTNDEAVFRRGSVAVDCCSYYWNPDEVKEEEQFAGLNFRATEISGAILNAQLERIDGMLDAMRSNKKRLLQIGLDAGLTSIKNNSLDHDCGTHLGFLFRSEDKARSFSKILNDRGMGCFLPIDTGRHVYTRWDPIMRRQGAHHPALDPFKLLINQDLNIEYSVDMCRVSLDLLGRSVLIGMHPDHDEKKLETMASTIREAADA